MTAPSRLSMLQKLRIKIVVVIVAVSAAVLLAAFCAVMAISYMSAYSPIQADLVAAVQRGLDVTPTFVIGRPAGNQRGGNDAADQAGPDAAGARDLSDVVQMQGGITPVALVNVAPDGTVLGANDIFYSMDEGVRTLAVEGALASGRENGLLRQVDVFYYCSRASDDTLTIAIADAGTLISTMGDMALGSGAVMIASLVVIALLAMLVARLITRPVREAWDRQTEFVADASHELKTPLTVILANTDILLAHPELTVGEQRRWVAGTHDEATRMKGLVGEMLFLARSDEHALAERATHGTVDLSAVVERALLAFDAVAFEAQVELESQVAPGVEVSGNEEQLERLAKVLVDNAVKYAGAQGRVRVRLAAGRKRGHAVFSVANTGPSIAREDQPRLFDRFWRSDAARERTGEGSYGLGLSIAKSIVDAHGGTIDVQSAPGQLTTFTVRL